MNETKLENGPAAASEGIDKTAGTSVFINSKKENIFKPFQAVSGVVQRKQPLPVLSNILFCSKRQAGNLSRKRPRSPNPDCCGNR